MKGEAWFCTCNLNIAGVVFCLPNFNWVLISSALFIFVFLLFYRRCSKFPNRFHFSLNWILREPSLTTSKMPSVLLFLSLTIHTILRKQVVQHITYETQFLKLYPSVRESQVGRRNSERRHRREGKWEWTLRRCLATHVYSLEKAIAHTWYIFFSGQ